MPRRWWWLAAAVPVFAGSWTAGTVSAHAQLLEITPADGEVVAGAPAEVVLRFNEPVSLTGGSARVLDDDAQEVSGEASLAGEEVRIPLPGDLADGTYTVTWQVVSLDSHRISGASVFHVGAPSSEGLTDLAIGDTTPWAVRAGAVGLSWIAYAGALIAAGMLWFLVSGRGDVGYGPRCRRLSPLIARAAVIAAVTTVAAVPFRVARLGGGLDSLADDELLWDSLRGPIGVSAAITALGMLVVAVLVERGAPPGIPAAVAVVALGGFAAEGHTRADLQAAMITSDVVHLAAAAVWIGGIAALVSESRVRVDPAELAVSVRRFSTNALLAVAVVAATGAVMAWVILPSAGALVSTGYGLALIVKIVIAATVAGIGAYNRWRLLPAFAAAGGGAGRGGNSRARSWLTRIVGAELVLLLAVGAVTSVVVTRSPVPATAASGSPATESTPLTLHLQVTLSNDGWVHLSISPASAGPNSVEVLVGDYEGRIVNPVEVPTLQFTQPELGVGPLGAELEPVEIGRYEGSIDLSFPGEWEIDVRVRVSDFESASGSTTATIE